MVFSGRVGSGQKVIFSAGLIICSMLISLLLFIAGRSTAADTVNLYETIKPVSGQSEIERNRVVRSSLATVFVRVTGDSAVLSRSAVKEALADAGRYVRSYYYRRGSEGEELLEVSFDAVALNSFLRRENIPLWGSTRPTTLMWIALEEGGKRQIIGNRSRDALTRVLREQELERGLNVLLPVMDLEDSANVQVADVWGLFESPLLKGAARYGASVVMAARVYPENNLYSGRLALFLQGQRHYFDFSQLNVEQIAMLATDRLASGLAAIYAVVEQGQGGWVTVQVDGINSVKDYAGVLNYLRKLAIVREVGPARAKGTSLILQTKIDGDSSRLVNAIALEHALAPVNATEQPHQAGSGNVATLHYVWRSGR